MSNESVVLEAGSTAHSPLQKSELRLAEVDSVAAD